MILVPDSLWRHDQTTRDIQYERNCRRHIETFMKGFISHPLGTSPMRDAAIITAWAMAASRERSKT